MRGPGSGAVRERVDRPDARDCNGVEPALSLVPVYLTGLREVRVARRSLEEDGMIERRRGERGSAECGSNGDSAPTVLAPKLLYQKRFGVLKID